MRLKARNNSLDGRGLSILTFLRLSWIAVDRANYKVFGSNHIRNVTCPPKRSIQFVLKPIASTHYAGFTDFLEHKF